jgi:peptide/nickel transport system substrate-binding protein
VITKPTRYIGVILTAVAAVALALYYRGPGDAAKTAGDRPAQRGGQIVASIRSEPRSFNRLLARDQAADLVSLLTHGRLVQTNRVTFELEPWLAERWDSSADGLTHTLHLRPGLLWSDGAPVTSADVLFSLQAALDPKVKSVIAGNLSAGGKPIAATAPDPATVVFTYAAPTGEGIGLLDVLPILPKHKLEASLAAGALASAWGPGTPAADIVGTGPFVLREHVAGQRLVFDRNPHYWRKAADGQRLPYLDRIVLEVVPDESAELLRLISGAIDIPYSELRSDDYVAARRAEEEGKLTLVELGVGTDADAFWFCLKPEKKEGDPRFAFVQKREFRQAISHAVDREEFAQTVFLGEAVPIWGPITPGNKPWFSPNVLRYPHDVAKARALLKSIGLEDRNSNGIVEDAAGTEARFTVLTQRGITYYERGTTVLREHAMAAGIALDIVPLEIAAVVERLESCDYDAIYMRPPATDLDPAGNLDFWLSSGSGHFWNTSQKTPATEWEKQADALMIEQARTIDRGRRRALFADVQRIYAENLPVLYFAAPRLFYGHSKRLTGVAASVLRPPVLWSADTLGVTAPGP